MSRRISPPEPAPPIEEIHMIDAACIDCEWNEAGDATDVGEDMWYHEQKGHTVETKRAWRLVLYDSTRTTPEQVGEYITGLIEKGVKDISVYSST